MVGVAKELCVNRAQQIGVPLDQIGILNIKDSQKLIDSYLKILDLENNINKTLIEYYEKLPEIPDSDIEKVNSNPRRNSTTDNNHELNPEPSITTQIRELKLKDELMSRKKIDILEERRAKNSFRMKKVESNKIEDINSLRDNQKVKSNTNEKKD